MSELLYLLSVLLAIAAYILAGVLLWVIVEGIWWIVAKLTGKEY